MNYELLQNVNEFNKYNRNIIKDIKQIINEKDDNIKFKNIMNIYNQINNNDNKKSELNDKESKTEKKMNSSNNYIIGEFEINENNKK